MNNSGYISVILNPLFSGLPEQVFLTCQLANLHTYFQIKSVRLSSIPLGRRLVNPPFAS